MSGKGADRVVLWDWTPRSITVTPWGPVQAVVIVAIMLATMALLDVTLFAVILGYRHPGAMSSDQAFDALSKLDQYVPAIVSGLITQAILSGGVLALANRKGGRFDEVLMLAVPKTGLRANMAIVAGFFAATYVLAGAVYVVFPYDPQAVVPFMGVIVKSSYWWLGLVMLVVAAPVFEELWFRGFLFPALAQSRIGVAGAALVSSGLWAVMHLGYPPQVIAIVFAIGLLLTAVLLRTGSLWIPMLCHGAYNGASFAYFFWFADYAGP